MHSPSLTPSHLNSHTMLMLLLLLQTALGGEVDGLFLALVIEAQLGRLSR